MKPDRIIMLLDNPLNSDARVEKEAASLSREGFNVCIYATDENKSLPESERRDGYLIQRKLPVHLKHPLRRGYRAKLAESLEMLRKEEFQILHCHDYHLLELATEIKKRYPEVFLTYDSHEYLKGWPYYKEIPGPVNRLKGMLVWRTLVQRESNNIGSCDLLITPSEALRNRMISDHKVHFTSLTIRNIPEWGESPQYRDIRQMLSIDPQQKILVHSGSVYMTRVFISALVDIVEGIPDLILLFIGDRPRHYDLREQWKAHQMVRFLDYSPQYLQGDLQQCDVGLAYTRSNAYEAHRLGSSNRVMEYSLSGLPIIGTDQITHRELEHAFGHVLTFNESSVDSLKHIVNEVIKRQEELHGKAIRCKDELSWENEMAPLIQLYKTEPGRTSL